MTTIAQNIICNIIRRLLNGENYRPEITSLIDATFMDQTNEFLQQIALAKSSQPDNPDWYKDVMMNENLKKSDIALNAGINMKTISNTFGTATKERVVEASNNHYDRITDSIDNAENFIEMSFSILLPENRVNFTSAETLKIFNSLSVRRAAIRGGLWSTAGKKVEKPLLTTLCRLLRVPRENFNQLSELIPPTQREVDYYIIHNQNALRCEVKLMGRGNPEGADVIHARDTNIFIGDRLSDTNKTQLDDARIPWVAMADGDTLGQFSTLLTNLGIENTPFEGNLDERLDEIFLHPNF